MRTKSEFAVEFIRMTSPRSGQPLGCIGIDNGDHVYLPAILHPSVIRHGDAGRAAFIQCYKAHAPVAAFQNAFFVESNWLRAELTTPFTHTVGLRTLTNTMLEAVAKTMLEAATTYRKLRRNGQLAGKADGSADAVLFEVALGVATA